MPRSAERSDAARIGGLGAAAFLFSLGHAVFLALQPFNRRIPAFLTLYTVLCAAIAALAWFARRQSAPKDGRTFWREGAIVLFGALVMRGTLFVTAPTLSDDIYRYVWDGRVQNAGISPYSYPPVAPELAALRDDKWPLINHPALRTVYPPVAQLVFRAAAAVRPTIQLQKLTFLFFDLALVFVLLALLRDRGKPASWAALYAWHPLAVVEFAGSGHMDSLMLFFWIAACLFFGRGRLRASGASFGLGALSKWITFVMTPWIALRGRRRTFGPFLLVAVLASAPFIAGLWVMWTKFAPEASGARAFANDWVFNPSFYGWLARVEDNPTHRKVFFGAILIVFSFWWARKNADPARYALGALFGLLLLSPVVHPWYVLWLLPFAALLGSAPAFLWAWTVGFAYVVQIRYAADGIWELPAWIPAVEYTLVCGSLALAGLINLRRPRAAEKDLPPLASPKVGVIIPALNEEKAIGLVIGDIPKKYLREVIVVDNGSTDGTAAAAASAGARVIREPVRGYGRAVQRGLAALSPDVDVAVVLDGDRSDFPEELPNLLKPIQEGRADFVIGSRTEAAEPGSLMPQQRFGNWLTCALIQVLYGHRYSDMGPFRAIRRAAIEDMRMVDETFGWNVEMQVKALQLGYRVAEVPVRYRPRIGQSKISGTIKGSFRAGTIILWAIYRYGFARR